MTVTDIRHILEAPYNRTVWKNFIQTQFTNNQLAKDDYTLQLGKSDLYTECYSLGHYAVDDYTKIGIFEVQLTKGVNLTRNRVGLRNLIKDLTKQVAGAMVVFVQEDNWRFSYISKRKVKNKDTNTIEDKETAPKRYTYLFGKGEKALTAAQRFNKLIQKQQGNIFQFLTLNDFEEAFSVEKLSKDFFNEYKKTYEDFVEFITGKRYLKKGNKFVETIIHPANFQLKNLFGNDEKQARDFCKRMMGRIVFLYFIQKKGWLAVAQGKKWGEGNQDYLFDLFKNSKHKDDFYTQELVPLFFKTLNNTASESEKNILRFPYLNGGLFDDSHDRKFNKLALPTEIFENLFNTFNNFNFTIYEDAPDEHTVAVDPEMLGHIFENLLEDNKDKGAFYTPKEIVHYMCRESLKEYLIASDELTIADSKVGKETISKIIQQQELTKEEIAFAEKNAFKIIDALEQVKICDPAIGSGAFPMGLLQEIFNTQIYLQELKGFTRKQTEAEIKKHIIEESIYGVDIDAGAVDIARLRFWLSLVVDETEPQPLPNLSFKIVCANTLIPLGKIKNLDMGGTKEIADGLAQVRHDYFNASMEEKTALETKFTSLQKKLLTTAKEWVSKEDAAIYQRLLEFSPFEESSCTWFDAWWMFGIENGFDIVIGNPPYDVYEGNKKDEIEILNKIQLYDKAKGGKLNAYKLFIAKSIDLLKPDGVFCQIFQNSFLADNSATKIRKFILEETSNIKIDSYPERDNIHKRVFESAKMSVCILLCKKTKNESSFLDLNIWEDKYTLQNYIRLWYDDIRLLDEKNYVIPTINEDELRLLIQVKSKSPFKFKDYTKCIEGELNMTFHKSYFTDNKNYPLIVKGAQVQRYFITNKPSQGEIQYLDLEKYQSDFGTSEKANHYKKHRIALQGITGANDKIRLVMTYLPKGIFCANSCNYIIIREQYETDINLKYILAISNSSLLNWIFRKSSTNSNVNCYEIDNLPIVIKNTEIQIKYSVLVDYIEYLYSNSLDQIITHTTNIRLAAHIEDVLNMMVYELYFEEHMKEVGIDVLQFINPKQIDNLKSNTEKAEVIKKFYLWLQTPDNQVRQRINIVDIKSPNILSKINLAVQ